MQLFLFDARLCWIGRFGQEEGEYCSYSIEAETEQQARDRLERIVRGGDAEYVEVSLYLHESGDREALLPDEKDGDHPQVISISDQKELLEDGFVERDEIEAN